MSASYFTVSLSDNLEETPEGFLIARDAVLGRTGFQTYKVHELPPDSARDLGIDTSNPDADIDLYRPASEVFSPETLASIEGKTVTDNHPPAREGAERGDPDDGNVNPENFKELAFGHVQNVRKGKEPLENGEYPILGDVHINAEPLLSEVKNRVKRELSLGYDYQIRRNGKRIDMHHIIVNHCAVVPKGRAGHEARINDSAPEAKKGVASGDAILTIKNVRRSSPVKLTWKNIWAAGIKALAHDAEPEELADAMSEMARVGDKHMDDKRTEDRRTEDRHMDDRKARDRRADDAKDRARDCFDRCLDGTADDADMNEVKKWVSEEAEEPEHKEAGDRKAKDRKAKDRKADDKHADDSEESEEEEAEQPTKIDVEDLRKTLSGDADDEDADEGDADDSDDDDDHIEGEWQEGEPKEDDFEKGRDKKADDKHMDDKKGKDSKAEDKGRAHDGALAVLKALRPVLARTNDKKVRAAYDAALKEVAKASKPRTGGYGDFAARARAHDEAPKSEVQKSQELDAIYAQARKEGRK